MRDHLSSTDVRGLLRLLAELRELGADPGAWRARLVANLDALCGAKVAVVTELRVNATPEHAPTNCAEAVTPLQTVDHGLDASLRERFYRELYFIDHRADDALNAVVPLYGSAFTIKRQNVIADRHWDRSCSANERFRPLGCDDFVMSMLPVASLGVISSMEVYRGTGVRFSERERLIIELLHEELGNDWNRLGREEGARLTPRSAASARAADGRNQRERARLRARCLAAHRTRAHQGDPSRLRRPQPWRTVGARRGGPGLRQANSSRRRARLATRRPGPRH